MNLTENLWMPLLAGLLSSLLATGITTALVAAARRPRSQRRNNTSGTLVHLGDSVQGDKINGDKVTLQRHEHHDHHHVHQSGPRSNRAPIQTEESEPWVWLISAGVATLVAVLAFILVWQYVLGLMVGAAITLVAAAAWLTVRTRGCPTCSQRLPPLWFNTAVGLISGVIVWGFILRHRADGVGLPAALAKIEHRYPRFDKGIEAKWAVLTTHGPDIPGLLGATSVFLIAFSMLALAAILVIVFFALHDAYSLSTAHSHTSRPAQSRGTGGTLATLLLATIAICLVAGPAEKFLEHPPEVLPQPGQVSAKVDT